MRLDLEMGCAGFYVCVKCLQHNRQYKYLLNSDHSRKITLKVIIVIINWGRKYRQVGIFGIFWSVFGIFRYL